MPERTGEPVESPDHEGVVRAQRAERRIQLGAVLPTVQEAVGEDTLAAPLAERPDLAARIWTRRREPCVADSHVLILPSPQQFRQKGFRIAFVTLPDDYVPYVPNVGESHTWLQYRLTRNEAMSDIVSWAQKADALLSFCIAAHNATWDSDNVLIRGGGVMGEAIVLTFAVECALKALLEKEGKEITGDLRTHDVHALFEELDPATSADASAVYSKFVTAEMDLRVRKPPTDALDTCLQNHARTFTSWRYDMRNAGNFYYTPMIYAACSLMTFANPTKTYSVKSATSSITDVTGGKTKGRSGP